MPKDKKKSQKQTPPETDSYIILDEKSRKKLYQEAKENGQIADAVIEMDISK